MDRRGFLGRMMATFGLAVVAPTDLLWRPDVQATEVVVPGAITGLTAMTQAVLAEIERRLQVQVPCAIPVEGSPWLRVGDPCAGHVLNRQISLSMADLLPWAIDREGVNVERYLKPAAAQLALAMRGVKGTGQLPLPIIGAQACWVKGPSGLSLRGVMDYDIQIDRHLVRFDALVAE